MPDYSKCIIYKLCCNDPSIEELYIGSTCNFRQRKWAHKSDCNNVNKYSYNFKVYQFIRENGGWENWSMVMIHEEAVESKLQKERLERGFIDDLKPSLNHNIPTRSDKEYREDNKELCRQRHKKWRDANKEREKERCKKWRETKKHQDFINA